MLLLCDNNGSNNGTTTTTTNTTTACCNRAFCLDCVAKSLGGGRRGLRAAQRLLNDDEDQPWHCVACRPPQQLVQLRERVAEMGRHEEEQQRTWQTVLDELKSADEEKQRCDRELDDCDVVEKTEEFRRELRTEEAADLSDEELEAVVQEAVRVWHQDWVWHEMRLSDRIASLLDELDLHHNMTPAECYNLIRSGERVPAAAANPRAGNDTSDSEEEENDESEPDWVRSANKAVDKQHKKDKRLSPFNPLDREYYRGEYFDDVEDLQASGRQDGGDDDDDEMESRSVRSGWNLGRGRPDEEAILAAKEWEDNELGVRVQAVIDEAQDTEETLEEEKRVVGSRRFLRDDYARLLPSRSKTRNGATTEPSTDHHRRNTSGVETANGAARMPEAATTEDSSNMPSSANSSAYTNHQSGDAEKTDKKPSPTKKVLFPSNASTTGSINSRRSTVSGPVVLCSTKSRAENGKGPIIRDVTMSPKLSSHLKIHQAEGVQFLWENCFSDYAYNKEGDAEQIGGCILAHCMGLGT